MSKKPRRSAPRPAKPAARSPRLLPARPAPSPAARWTFLTNHSHVLILLAQNPALVLREVAVRVGITERAVQRIIADLEEAGVIERQRVGRQNNYRVRTNIPLRHPIEAHRTIGDLVGII
jgi:DNA-binding transcriptional ArsR family regulator